MDGLEETVSLFDSEATINPLRSFLKTVVQALRYHYVSLFIPGTVLDAFLYPCQFPTGIWRVRSRHSKRDSLMSGTLRTLSCWRGLLRLLQKVFRVPPNGVENLHALGI